MPARRPRRAFAIDTVADGEPLKRADIQFDLLSFIFNNQVKAFTDSPPSKDKVSFRDLYVNSILRSPKSKGVLREKLLESPSTFATDFAKLSLITNVGRIATNMSFFAEMRTAQRTYHPIPSLQRTNGNLLDAPRIKAILKSCTLEGDANTKSALATPAQVLARSKDQPIPVISMPNLLTILTNHSEQIGREHIPEMEFRELFLPNDASSESRARAFLWLCHHYYEGPSPENEDDYDGDGDAGSRNPFSDPTRPGKMPRLVILTHEEAALENIDPEEEKDKAKQLISHREAIVQNNLLKESAKESKAKASSPGGTETPTKPKAKRTASTKATPSSQLKRKADEVKEEDVDETPLKRPRLDEEENINSRVNTLLRPVYLPERHVALRESLSPMPESRSHRYEAYKIERPRTMLQHAWHSAATSDPLAESDDELDDQHVRRDHAQRLSIIARLRGKAPTPEPDGLRTIPLQLNSWHDDLFV
ncbi:hypothetical protein FB45DRAFT_1027876 [Roridomyces roridus]|uniref:Ino eighty subunit 1 n=1 Tax=Roridomyces roridus TaxID=1738132 RepID=A0AAD7BV03_9AGAR|nr:hypothetical protein FB45DRAFT_1027876 [Roridomyces roridus]